jgi:branched-chain amino acid transport system substrate-binding protein
LTEDNKVLTIHVDGIGVNSECSAQMPYSFATMFQRAGYSPSWAEFRKLYPNAKRVAIVAPEDPSTIEDAQHLGEAAKAHGLEVVAEEHFAFGTADFYPMWTKLLAAKPDVVAESPGVSEWFGNMIKQGRELGFKGPFYIMTSAADAQVIAKIGGEMYATDILTATLDFSSPKMPPIVKEMGRAIKQKAGVEMTADSFLGFEAIWILAQAIENAQTPW